MEINPYIFREYDIRGVVDQDLSEDLARLLGRAYATFAKEHQKNNIAIGYDCRHTSEGYARAFAEGLADEGLDSCLTGMGPTPQLYYALHAHQFGGGLQVTGSHNPPNMNGFKLCLGTAPLTGDEIRDLRKRALALLEKGPSKGSARGQITELALRQEYINTLIENCREHIGPRKLRVVVDAGNGVGGLVGPQVLRELGVEVIEMYCEPDGNFPNHHPDPTVPEYIKDMIAKVRESGADFGIGWDGDADRIGVVDENGEMVFGDMLLLIYAREIVKEIPGAEILCDVKCSSRVFKDLEARGAKPIMWKTGHSLIKKKLKEIGAPLGGELAGHIVFKHRFYGFDDALYCAARLVEIMSHREGGLSTLIDDLPPMVATPEIHLDCPDEIKFQVIEEAQSVFSEYETVTIDGIRVAFEKGWGLVRASNTTPVLVTRFEAETAEDLEDYKKLMLERINSIMERLS